MTAMYMDLQPDWEAAGDETCWLNVYERRVVLNASESQQEKPTATVEGAVNAHFQLAMQPAATGKAETAHLVEVTKREMHWVQVQVASGSTGEEEVVHAVFQAPTAASDVFQAAATEQVHEFSVHRSPRPQLHCVDVSCEEKYAVVGGADGRCVVWDPLDRVPVRPLVGHVLDVTSARFFPSGKVALTGSLDFTLRIWSVESGQCAAVLKGHRGGIEDVAIVGRGRNVLSCASDGAIHLWCCANQQIVAKWTSDNESAVHCMSLLDDSAHMFTAESLKASTAVDNEFETEAKLLFAGLDSGDILGVDVRSRELAMNLEGTASIVSCAVTSRHGTPTLLTGSEDGLLTTWDLRQTSSPLHVLSRSPSAVQRIAVYEDRVWTANADGVSASWSHLLAPTNATPTVSSYLTGPQYDPVRGLAVGPQTGRVFTACRDGLLREYIPHFLTM
ncbi:hypothetical protein Poli38472_009590 [Pythium oligandrum]|uniref:Uncharacterized protein n=1 Tax=Pythium oligandrum TaxID=41045 RepID=A0A8K1CH83_PYTOL|nr:hypothetical protein Poli38472_009590 [Pythium oligandrum]|eukprot:TMW62097.1 hypothetical protein Poli38472_009590 [Pythium oligandrum]